eukprot:TRINITY_DN13404_c0_g1_i1.p1 TRINITY_DN13404_c0_g1~~TRINITY_DN13404_c0_g1_i1.p1  ORF type:complete len:654 (+),score=261.88 TRINITY_DN13404_c0_g1_i1:293-2254(+)
MEELSKLSVGELKKKLLFLSVPVPSGATEKADLVKLAHEAQEKVDAARKKAAEEKEKADRERAAKEQKQRDYVRGAAGPNWASARPLDFENAAQGSEKEVIDLHLLTEAQLKARIEKTGHEIPEGTTSKFYLVSLCRQAEKDPIPLDKRRPKPKPPPKPATADDSDSDPEDAIEEYRRPTVGDRVQIVPNNLTKRYIPTYVGHVLKIIKDDGGSTPYKLAGLDRQCWLGTEDVKWPDKKKGKKVKLAFKPEAVGNPNHMPKQVIILQDRYGCKYGDVRQCLKATPDGQHWVLSGGRQVPKFQEGQGWARVNSDAPDGPPPPPPDAAGPDDPFLDADLLAQMEEMQAQFDQEAEEAKAAAPAPPPPPTPEEPAPASEILVADDFDGKDPKEMSAGEIKKRLRKYGAALLIGLSEKSELAAALLEARRKKEEEAAGLAEKGQADGASAPRASDAEMAAQMEAIQSQMEGGGGPGGAAAAATVQAKATPEGAAVAVAVADEAEEGAAASGGKGAEARRAERKKRQEEFAKRKAEADSAAAAEAKARAEKRQKRLQAKKKQDDVAVLSDGEDDVAVQPAGPTISLDDDENASVAAPAAKKMKKAAVSEPVAAPGNADATSSTAAKADAAPASGASLDKPPTAQEKKAGGEGGSMTWL